MNRLSYFTVIACLAGAPALLTGCEDNVDVEPLDNEQVDETPADTDDQMETPAETTPPLDDTSTPSDPGMPPPPQ